MEPKGSLPRSQESATGPYPDPDASSSEALCDIQFWFKFTQQHSYLEKHIMSLSYDENRQKKMQHFGLGLTFLIQAFK